MKDCFPLNFFKIHRNCLKQNYNVLWGNNICTYDNCNIKGDLNQLQDFYSFHKVALTLVDCEKPTFPRVATKNGKRGTAKKKKR